MRKFNSLKELIDCYRAETNKQTFTVKTIPWYDMFYFYKIKIDSSAQVIKDFGYVS